MPDSDNVGHMKLTGQISQESFQFNRTSISRATLVIKRNIAFNSWNIDLFRT